MQRRGWGACSPRVNHLVEISIFALLVLALLAPRPGAIQPPDVQVWSDETERRLLAGSTHRDF